MLQPKTRRISNPICKITGKKTSSFNVSIPSVKISYCLKRFSLPIPPHVAVLLIGAAEAAVAGGAAIVAVGNAVRDKYPLRKRLSFGKANGRRAVYQLYAQRAAVIRIKIIRIDYADGIRQPYAVFKAEARTRAQHQKPALVDSDAQPRLNGDFPVRR